MVSAARRARSKFRRQLALLGDALKHCRTPAFEFGEVSEAFFELAQLRVIEAAGLLFAIARDERHSRAIAEEFDGCRYLGQPER